MTCIPQFRGVRQRNSATMINLSISQFISLSIYQFINLSIPYRNEVESLVLGSILIVFRIYLNKRSSQFGFGIDVLF